MKIVKICGVTRPEDAELSVGLGADLLGLNFYPPSPRCLSVDAARRIAEAVRGRVPLVGVFVDRPPAEVEEVGEGVGLDLLQFHGDEPAGQIERFGAQAIQVLRLEGEPARDLTAGYPSAWGFLAEVRHEAYGGVGRSWPYEWVGRLTDERPVLVAGGVTPDNARAVLSRSGAAGIDVCSGVESAPGVKDEGLLRQLFDEIRDVR